MTGQTTLVPTPKLRPGKIDRLLHLAGLDFHILATLLFRGWSVLAGGATALLIPTFLSPSQQGYYYTFTAVLATQIFFELGLNHVLTQLSSHAAAHLRRKTDGQFEGEMRWQSAVVSLLTLSTKWNSLMASLFFVALLIGGGLFFSHKGSLSTSLWLATWIVLVAAAAINLALSAQLAICEGLGEVGQVARLRLSQSMAGYVLLWALLLSGQGLWAATAVPLVSALGTAWWISRQPLLKGLLASVAAEGVAITDYNKLQSLTTVDQTLRIEPLADKAKAFGWAVREVDGHDHAALADRLGSVPWEPGKPSFLIAHTTKGKGVSFMENSVDWHYKSPSAEQLAQALRELNHA